MNIVSEYLKILAAFYNLDENFSDSDYKEISMEKINRSTKEYNFE